MKVFSRTQRVVLAVVAVAATAVTVYFAGIYLAALGYVAAGTTAFVIVYHMLQRWWETEVGKNIMMMMFALAAITDAALINFLLDRPQWMRIVFWILYLAIGTAAWWRTSLVIGGWRTERARRKLRSVQDA